ncbi:MAG: gamma-glutamyltransferase [Candidatus Hydrogenedentes bacterium]|nr:gamma-glutamyltransferase [Candidatus Hydrogenedentota bacterium]
MNMLPPLNDEIISQRNQNRSTVVSRNGMVCTSQPLASMAGIDVLKAGGNAIDAAICANAMLSVVEPMNCGPGGDLFAIVWDTKSQRLHGLNASGRAPYDWSLDAARELGLDAIPGYSPLAWTVPGCVSGWKALHDKLGRASVESVLGPAMTAAREGFPLSPIIAGEWPFDAEKYPTLAKAYMPNGKAPRFGEIFVNDDMANTFEILIRDGFDAFYKGEIAERIVEFSKAQGGRFSMRDFETHEATWSDPVTTSYRGYDVWELPPNGQGIAVLQMLNILDNFDFSGMTPNSAEHLHLFVEAKKLAYEDRAKYYADPDFADVPIEWLISKDYGRDRAKLIDPTKAATNIAAGTAPDTSETIYLTAADNEGNMVSLIQSTYSGWGSHFVPAGLGFAIQNRGDAFSLNPDHPNRLEPHKRPFHTIIPAFVTQSDKPVFSFGVMHGDFQPQGHVQVLMNLLDFGFSPQQAGEQPRVYHGGSSDPSGDAADGGGFVRFERHVPQEVKEQLEAMGHTINWDIGTWGGYQGIWRVDEPLRYFGGSDPRKDGCAIGY